MRGSKVWSYFTRCDDPPNKAMCDLCGKVLSRGVSKLNTTSLWTHLGNSHPEVLPSDEYVPAEQQIDNTSTDNQCNVFGINSSKATGSKVWTYFTRCDDPPNKAACDLCGKVLSRGVSLSRLNTTSLWTHLANSHPEVMPSDEFVPAEQQIDNTSTDNQCNAPKYAENPVWLMYTKCGDDQPSKASCNLCGFLVSRGQGHLNISSLWSHLERKHADSFVPGTRKLKGVDYSEFTPSESEYCTNDAAATTRVRGGRKLGSGTKHQKSNIKFPHQYFVKPEVIEEDAHNAAHAFLTELFGADNYRKWLTLKTETRHCDTQSFVTWLLALAQSAFDNIYEMINKDDESEEGTSNDKDEDNDEVTSVDNSTDDENWNEEKEEEPKRKKRKCRRRQSLVNVRATKVKEEAITGHYDDVGFDGQNLTVDSMETQQNIMHDEQNIMHDEQNIVHDEQNIAHDEQNIVHDEQNIVHDEQNIVHDKVNIAVQDKQNITQGDWNISQEEQNIGHDESNTTRCGNSHYNRNITSHEQNIFHQDTTSAVSNYMSSETNCPSISREWRKS